MTNFQKLKVLEIEKVNENVNGYKLGPAEKGQTLAPFIPGQYINLAYEIDGATTTRPYSIASSIRDWEKGFYMVFIYRFAFTSSWLFENVKEGSIIYGSIPTGEFVIDPNMETKEVIGISGGMSVTPLRSIAKSIAEGSMDNIMFLFSGWDSSEELLFEKDFLDYSQKCDNFNYVYVVADGSNETSCPFQEKGYINRKIIEKYTSSSTLNNAFYMACGPSQMYHTLEEELGNLLTLGDNYIHEIPGEIKSPKDFPDYPLDIIENTYTISVYRGCCSGLEEIDIPAKAGETVEVALERAGLTYMARCRSGVCGCCLSTLESGTVFVPKPWDKRTKAQISYGLIHPCCSFPLSDLKILIK